MQRRFVALPLLALFAFTATAAVRVNVRISPGHPLRRPARTVVVRPTRVVVPARLRFAPVVVWNRSTYTLPPRDRVSWEDTDTIRRGEDWVDTHLSVNASGDRLLLNVRGRVQVDFAEVYFENGDVQVVDFHEETLNTGSVPLLDFRNGRRVDSVRVIARSLSGQSKLSALLVR